MPEPTPWVMQVFALPLGLTAAVALGVLWMRKPDFGRPARPRIDSCT